MRTHLNKLDKKYLPSLPRIGQGLTNRARAHRLLLTNRARAHRLLEAGVSLDEVTKGGRYIIPEEVVVPRFQPGVYYPFEISPGEAPLAPVGLTGAPDIDDTIKVEYLIGAAIRAAERSINTYEPEAVTAIAKGPNGKTPIHEAFEALLGQRVRLGKYSSSTLLHLLQIDQDGDSDAGNTLVDIYYIREGLQDGILEIVDETLHLLTLRMFDEERAEPVDEMYEAIRILFEEALQADYTGRLTLRQYYLLLLRHRQHTAAMALLGSEYLASNHSGDLRFTTR